MAKKQYTQTVEPISRIAEKIFGWLAWIALLAITGFILFFALVMVNDPAFIENFRQEMQNSLSQVDTGGVSTEQMTDQLLALLNNFWIIALYLAVPLILGLLGLIMMRRRIMAGFLLLIAGILTAPLVFGVITGLIPLFFVIAAILLFVRKDRVITHDDDRPAGEERRRDDTVDEGRAGKNAAAGTAGAAYGSRNEEDDMKTNDRTSQSRGDADREENDLESTRQYQAIDDETEHDYRSRRKGDTDTGVAGYDDERSERGNDRYVDNDNISGESDRYIDGNIDSAETTEPVTEEEYSRRGGTSGFNDGVSGDDPEALDDTMDKQRGSLKNNEYDYDASSERRNNLDRRNNGE